MQRTGSLRCCGDGAKRPPTGFQMTTVLKSFVLKSFVRKTTGWLAISSFWSVLLASVPALATQGHAGIEGVWVHQFAHLFFLFSMLLLIYWLRQAGLVKQPGWRSIQYAALFFILWNVDTLLVHFLDEQIRAVSVTSLGNWQIQISTPAGYEWLAPVYYLIKLDHLLCVPAMVFLMLGLRHMLKEVSHADQGKGVR